MVTAALFCYGDLLPHNFLGAQFYMHATFVLSTGRCGTQWLTEKLQMLYPHYVVTHEPLSFDYRPDINTEQTPLQYNEGLIMEHLSCIQGYLDTGTSYIETGFPCWRHLQWFHQQLKGNMKVIYIHRDPLQTVQSLLKLNAFVPPFLPHLPIKNLFLPLSGHGYLSRWQHLWPQLNPAEKNLWYWAEIQAHALTLEAQWSKSDWLTLDFNTLFTTQTEQKLTRFLGTPHSSTESNALGHVDQYGNGLVPCQITFPLLHQAKEIDQLAERLGYRRIFDAATNNSDQIVFE